MTDPTPLRADGDFYARAFDGSVALPIAGYDYGGGWRIHRQDLHLLEHQLASLQLLFQAFPNAMARLFAQHSLLFPKVVDQLQLLLVHPAGQCDQQKPERVQGFRHEESNIITALHGGPVGDPLQIYADRFSGYYGQRIRVGDDFLSSFGLGRWEPWPPRVHCRSSP